jgi:hypothetical protein
MVHGGDQLVTASTEKGEGSSPRNSRRLLSRPREGMTGGSTDPACDRQRVHRTTGRLADGARATVAEGGRGWQVGPGRRRFLLLVRPRARFSGPSGFIFAGPTWLL